MYKNTKFNFIRLICGSLVLNVLCFSTLALAGNVVPVNENNPTDDSYIGYQWALNNQGQSVRRDIGDDLHSIQINSNPKANIGWNLGFDTKFKRDVIVAVIDSGVDSEHPQLRGHIALNDKECVDGDHIPIGEVGDKDQNGFEGDCQGWSFVAPDKKRARLSDDDNGHGTHIAGIIAAAVNDGVGTSGLSNRIKILPLKVYDDREDRNQTFRQISISERVAQAIDYAIIRKADVINLSLGWPIGNNTDKVKKSIDSALAAGIVIVAGAGNDRHEAQIYPCSHPGVICVGSIDLDGQVSRFSNFGGHVDILAPGGDILSTWPQLQLSNLFGPKGYEILSGTSQATPYVSGAAAILKGVYPGISNQEIRARLSLSAQKPSSELFTLSGLLNIQGAVDLKQTQTTVPNFKALDRVAYDSKSKFILPLRLENLGSKSESVEVKLASLNKSIALSYSKKITIAPFSKETLSLEGSIQDLDATSTLRYTVTINGRVYQHQVQVVRDLNMDASVKSFKINSSVDLEELNLSSIRTYGVRDLSPEYWRTEKLEDGVKVFIYRLSKDSLEEAGSFIIPNISAIQPDISVMRVDANYDGVIDYFIGGVVADDKDIVVGFQYSYIGSNFKALFGANSHMTLKYEVAYDGQVLPLRADQFARPNLRVFRFGSYNSSSFGRIAVPAYYTVGATTKPDQNPDAFAFEPIDSRQRLFYLEPLVSSGATYLQVRTFFNYNSTKQIRSALKLNVKDNFDIQTIFSQTEDDFNKGIIRVLASAGNGILRKYFVLNITGSELQNQKVEAVVGQYQGLDLTSQGVDETLTNGPEGESVGSNIVGIFTSTKSRAIILNKDSGFSRIDENVPFDLDDPYERILGLVKTFQINGENISFYEADTRLNVIGTRNGKLFKSDSPIYRSSFLPGQMFTQRFYPLFVGKENQKIPALYVDNTALFSPTVLAWTLSEENELIAPMRLNFEIPSGCQSMNPARFPDSTYALTLLCKNPSGAAIKFVELK